MPPQPHSNPFQVRSSSSLYSESFSVSQLNCKARAFRENEPKTSESNTDNSAKFFYLGFTARK